MSTVLFNPTNEEFTAQHQGVDVIMAPYPDDGHMVKVDDARARHVLNILAPRGLTTLEYGDDLDDSAKKKAKAVSGIQRNKDFKRKQVVDFNQINYANKLGNREYAPPAKHLQTYADEIGIKLEQPYTPPDVGAEKIGNLVKENEEKDKQIKEQSNEISKLGSQVEDLTEKFSQLLDAIRQPGEKELLVGPDDDLLKFRTLNKVQFKVWFKDNFDEIAAMPEDIQGEINARHEKLFGSPLPDTKPK